MYLARDLHLLEKEKYSLHTMSKKLNCQRYRSEKTCLSQSSLEPIIVSSVNVFPYTKVKNVLNERFPCSVIFFSKGS